jgi:glycine oxidase
MLPVRGQMLLYKLDAAPFAAVVNEGTRYLVPRTDGHVLFGATIEEVGFDTSTTESGIANLIEHATSLLPQLTEDRLVKTWAGLRPGTFDGFPYIGPLSHSSNLFVATGHFKAGLHLSPGTAEIVADLVEQKTPSIDLRPFAPSRTNVGS